MKILYYFFRYMIVILAGYFLKTVGIISIFDLQYIMFIPYNFLAILLGVKRPLESRRDISYQELLIPILILSILLNSILIYYSNIPFSGWVILSLINIAEWILMRPRYDKEKEIIDKNIEEYFKTHKR